MAKVYRNWVGVIGARHRGEEQEAQGLDQYYYANYYANY